jgi:sec-independent protein translocase protein TatA
MMGLDNPIHILFVLILLLLVFGAKRLPEMGRSLGTGLRGFKDSLSGVGGNGTDIVQTPPPAAVQPAPVPAPAVPVAAATTVNQDDPVAVDGASSVRG